MLRSDLNADDVTDTCVGQLILCGSGSGMKIRLYWRRTSLHRAAGIITTSTSWPSSCRYCRRCLGCCSGLCCSSLSRGSCHPYTTTIIWHCRFHGATRRITRPTSSRDKFAFCRTTASERIQQRNCRPHLHFWSYHAVVLAFLSSFTQILQNFRHSTCR